MRFINMPHYQTTHIETTHKSINNNQIYSLLTLGSMKKIFFVNETTQKFKIDLNDQSTCIYYGDILMPIKQRKNIIKLVE